MPYRTFQEIVALVQSRERESITLDYKVDITNDLERAKKELAKDVSAFANSQGGAIILGIDEQKGVPVEPIQGVPSLIDARQKTTDWLDQTLNQNISQRVNVTIRPFELPDDPERCVIVIDIPPSPRAPHMVTYQQDNRYYRRYFKRHQFESLVAAEYEVREMFMRSLRYRDEVETLLEHRRYLDRFASNFCHNEFTCRIAEPVLTVDPMRGGLSQSIAVFVAVPTVLANDYIPVGSEEMGRWVSECRTRYGLPLHSRLMLDGLLLTQPAVPATNNRIWEEFIFIGQSGLIEYATTRSFLEWRREILAVDLTFLLERFWAFLAIIRDIYRLFGIPGSLRLACNLTEVMGRFLTHFGQGWLDLDHSHMRLSDWASLDRHLQVIHELSSAELGDAECERLVRETDLRIEQAFGYAGLPRSFDREIGAFAGFPFLSTR